MTLRPLAVFMWVSLIATAAMAGEEHRTHVKIAIDGDSAEHQVIEFDGEHEIEVIHDDCELSAEAQAHGEHEVRVIRKEKDVTN